MIRQCAWCNRILGPAAPLEDASITHGMCPDCHHKELAASWLSVPAESTFRDLSEPTVPAPEIPQ